MKKIFFRYFVAIGLLFYFPVQSKAWGLLGHRIVRERAAS
jgi:hypothetical protein